MIQRILSDDELRKQFASLEFLDDRLINFLIDCYFYFQGGEFTLVLEDFIKEYYPGILSTLAETNRKDEILDLINVELVHLVMKNEMFKEFVADVVLTRGRYFRTQRQRNVLDDEDCLINFRVQKMQNEYSLTP